MPAADCARSTACTGTIGGIERRRCAARYSERLCAPRLGLASNSTMPNGIASGIDARPRGASESRPELSIACSAAATLDRVASPDTGSRERLQIRTALIWIVGLSSV